MGIKGLGRRGIAAANIEIEKTGVSATTIHNMFEESFSYVSRHFVPLQSPFRPFPQQPLLADIVSLRVFSCSNEWLPVRWRV